MNTERSFKYHYKNNNNNKIASPGGNVECLSQNKEVTNKHMGSKKHKVK